MRRNGTRAGLGGFRDPGIPLRRIAKIAGVGEDLVDRTRDFDRFVQSGHGGVGAGRSAWRQAGARSRFTASAAVPRPGGELPRVSAGRASRAASERAAARGPFHETPARQTGAARHAFLIFSSILKTPFGEPTNSRLKDFPRQRRSSVLRRVRERSAMGNSFGVMGSRLRRRGPGAGNPRERRILPQRAGTR